MAKYIAKHNERNHETGEDVPQISAVYDTQLDNIYGQNKSLNWAKATAQYMKGFVEYEDEGNTTVVYESKGFRRGNQDKRR